MTKSVKIQMVNQDTGEIIYDGKPVLKTFGYSGFFQGDKFCETFLKSFLRGLEKYPNMTLEVRVDNYSVPFQSSLF